MTRPINFGRSKKRSPKALEDKAVRHMEKYYTEREEVMSPMHNETYRDSDNPARKDYRMMQRLRRRGR